MTTTPKKITEFPELTTPTVNDVWQIVSGGTTYKIKASTVLALLAAASAAETTTGTEAGKYVTPDGLAGSDYGKRMAQANLNASVALTTSDKAYITIPAAMNGWNLVGVSARVGDSAGNGKSSSGAVTITVKNGTTSMLSTNLTIDQGEASSATAATAAVIDTENDHVATDDSIEVACSGAGTGATYARVTLIFQKP
ncbi:MAG: hypothetical protein AAGU05_02430 [Anaerolineaceae bacterium]